MGTDTQQTFVYATDIALKNGHLSGKMYSRTDNTSDNHKDMENNMNNSILTLGVDIGSTTSKCVIMRNGSELVSKQIVSAGIGTSGPDRAIGKALEESGVDAQQIHRIVATGYGRNNFQQADSQLSELSCHAKGARVLFSNARTVIDIGGQDAKVLQLSEDGSLLSFVMNDKCAAGTGRFLEVMARILEVDVSELQALSEKSANAVAISSTCTVFAESEVISQLASNADIHDVVAGIHRSVAVRAASLAKRLPIVPEVVMTGGVSLNAGVVHALEKELNIPIATSPLSQFAGAIGAAVFAYEGK